MTNPLPRPLQERDRVRSPAPGNPIQVVHDWKQALGTHWRWWLHRRRLQWKQVAAAIIVTATTILLWLGLVAALD